MMWWRLWWSGNGAPSHEHAGRTPLLAPKAVGGWLSLLKKRKGPGGDSRAFPSAVNGGGAYFSATALTAS